MCNAHSFATNAGTSSFPCTQATRRRQQGQADHRGSPPLSIPRRQACATLDLLSLADACGHAFTRSRLSEPRIIGLDHHKRSDQSRRPTAHQAKSEGRNVVASQQKLLAESSEVFSGNSAHGNFRRAACYTLIHAGRVDDAPPPPGRHIRRPFLLREIRPPPHATPDGVADARSVSAPARNHE